MMTRKIQLSEIAFEEEELQAAEQVLKSGRLREGSKIREFEDLFQKRTGVKHAIATSSGTTALHLAYLALLKAGDEVLVPAFTFIATASMIVMAGAKPVFCDINPETWTLDPQDVLQKLRPKTRALAGVHLFGNVCNISDLEKIAKEHRLAVVWDAAQALGANYQNKDVAQFQEAVCFSFYPSKNITTGEGGMVTTSDDRLAAKIRLLKNHGQSQKYVHEIIGFNYRMSEVEAVLGGYQIQKLDYYLARRKMIALKYQEGFRENPLIQTQRVSPSCNPSYNYFSIALRTSKLKISRDAFAEDLSREGVPCAVHYPIPLHHQPCFKEFQKHNLPCSEDLAKRILSLPMHPFLSEEDADFIIHKVTHLAEKYSKI